MIGRSATLEERTINITKTGRRSGEPRRTEIVFYRFGESVYLSGIRNRVRAKCGIKFRTKFRTSLPTRHPLADLGGGRDTILVCKAATTS
jgi:hypothetical protein